MGTFKVLSLDGGGGKGLYTLGVLYEVEALLGGGPLNKHFDLFYGTSTGSIIAAALALGASVEQIKKFYIEKLPPIMATFSSSGRTAALRKALGEYFQEKKFDELKVGLGIVATNWDDKRPLIFKSLPGQAHGMQSTFQPGFGVTIADAVEASCSAYPFFEEKEISPANMSPVKAVDGGFVANNPSMFALIDVRSALKIPEEDVRILSVGTGTYPEKFPFYAMYTGVKFLLTKEIISNQFAASANSTAIVFKLMTPNIASVRVNDAFVEPELATSLFEHRKNVLQRLYSKGRDSFGKHEAHIKKLLVET